MSVIICQKKDIAFCAELEEMGQTMTGLKVAHILSEEYGNSGETGFINAALIRKYGGDLSGKEFFLCGPPVMMEMVLKELEELKVPQQKIHLEKFSF